MCEGPEVLSSEPDEAKLIAEITHPDSSLPASPSRIKLKLSNTFLTPKMVKVIAVLDFSWACCPDCIPVVILKNCEPRV